MPRIIIAGASEGSRTQLNRLLTTSGYAVFRLCASGGELRRMAIVRALSQRPDFLFADEPTGDLDDENTHLVLSALRDYAHERNKGVFIVTHESDAMEYADRGFRMDGGQLSEDMALTCF